MLKINKGKRTVGKANKGINVEKIIIGLKKLKLKKERKKKREREENSTELQKPKQKQKFMTTNKKCDRGKKKTQKLNWISQCQ